MNLIPQSQLAAAQIDSINRETAGFVRAQLSRAYSALWQTGNPQDVLDALGTSATAALQNYALFFGVLTQIGEAGDLVPPVFEIYQPQPDGTVLYCPPPAPEEETEEPAP